MQQYLRKCSLIVADSSGNGLDLSRLRVSFEITKNDASTPNSASIKVFNLSDTTANKVRSEFTTVTLSAGYEGSSGVIFDGTIRQTRLGRENVVDTYIDISAADGDQAHNFAYVNTTLAAGATQATQLNAAIAPMSEYGVTPGYIGPTTEDKLPRGKPMYGLSRKYLRQSSKSANSTWSIQDRKVNVIPMTGVLPHKVTVLTPSTGLIGTPEQTEGGIEIKCLINPDLRVGCLVQLPPGVIAEGSTPEPSKTDTTAPKPLSPLAPDGTYRILTVGYSGDTRGNDWYANLVCISADVTAQPGEEVADV